MHWERAGPAVTTVDPADIRGLVTTLLESVGRLPRSRHEGRLKQPPLNAPEGCAKPGPRLLPDVMNGFLFSEGFDVSGDDGDLLGDGPHEGDQLAGHRGDGDVGMFAAADESAEPLAEPDLSLPGDVADGLGESLEALADVKRDLGGESMGPRALHQGAAGVGVAGLGDATLATGFSRGVLAGVDADKGCELSRRIEPGQVAHLGHNSHGGDLLNTSESLQGIHDRTQAPGRQEFLGVFLDSVESLDLLVHSAQVL